jgi:hypothetical protein
LMWNSWRSVKIAYVRAITLTTDSNHFR